MECRGSWPCQAFWATPRKQSVSPSEIALLRGGLSCGKLLIQFKQMNPAIIGLYSPAQGSGKSTIAQILKEQRGYECVSFAGPLKQMSIAFFEGMGYSKNQARHLIYNKDYMIPGLNITVRKIMQTIGTDWGREIIDKDVWVKIWQMRILQFNLVTVDDVRFENEAQTIKELGGQVWKVIRPGVENADSHKSEGLLDDWGGFDRLLINGGSINQLEELTLKTIDGDLW